MSFEIHAQEFHVTTDGFEIRTRCPKSEITEHKILGRIKANNLHPGDKVAVMCMDHNRITVHAYCEYLVTHVSERTVQHQINDRDIKQVKERTYRIAQIRDWWEEAAAEKPKTEKSDPEPDKQKSADPDAAASIEWNLGRRKHEVIVNGEVVFEGSKDDCKKYLEDAA